MDVGGDDHPAAGDLLADQLGVELLALGDPGHLRRDDAVAGEVDLGAALRVGGEGGAVLCRVAFKPTSSILTPVESVTRSGEATEVRTKGRHDPCVGIRGTPVVEAMMALVLADHKLLHRAQCG